MMLHQYREQQTDSYQNQSLEYTQCSNQTVETYLDRVCLPLSSTCDEASRLEVRAEMRVHIESLIEANLELGDTTEDAVRHALDQFGRSRRIQREWRSALTPNLPVASRRSFKLALGFNSLACVAALTIIPLGIQFADGLGWRAVGTIADLGIYGIPTAAGIMTGMIAPRRPEVATLKALLTLMLPMMALDAWQSRGMGDTMWEIGAVSQLVIFLLCWIPFGCAGAGVGRLVKCWSDRRCRTVPAGNTCLDRNIF